MALRNAFDSVATESTQQDVRGTLCILAKLLKILRIPAGFDPSLNRSRVTASIESGTVTNVTNVTTLSNIDVFQGRQLVAANIRNAWGNTVARRFS